MTSASLRKTTSTTRIWIAVTAVVFAASSVLAGVCTVAAVEQSTTDFAHATQVLESTYVDLVKSSSALSESITAARELQFDSTGRVLDGRVLEDHAAVIAAAGPAQQAIAVAVIRVGADVRSAAARSDPWPWELQALTSEARASAEPLGRIVANSNSQRHAVDLAEPAVVEAVTEWQAERDRAEAARIEAERVVVEAETTRRFGGEAPESQPRDSQQPQSYSVGPSAISIYVGTSTDSTDTSAMQGAVDAGGQVAIWYPTMGFTVIAAHNYNDATALSLSVGDLITFSGAASGTWRVVNSIDVPNGASSETVTGLGVLMMIQTCYFGTGTSRVVGLVPA